jgi:hypothetical protein
MPSASANPQPATQPESPVLTAKQVIDQLMLKIEAVHNQGGQLDVS